MTRLHKYTAFTVCMAISMAGSRISAADYLAEGHEAFMNYDFELASELYAKYAKTLKTKPDEEGERLLEKFQRQLDIAESSLDNVQKIEVIDRIDVPAADFVAAIPLPAEEGLFLSKEKVPFKERANESDYVFSSASGDFRMWTERGEDGVPVIYEASRLLDGSWETPGSAGDVLNDGGSVRNPFMLTDGQTLYFAADGDGSMGGYDIFVATRDSSTGEYLQPIGVGYPFNSPYNEYMMAIDEENGIGWWVTDRNQIEGKVSVYVFFTNDVRKNYVPDEEDDIVSLARLGDILVTQDPEKDYGAIMAEIDGRRSSADADDDSGIRFVMPGGRVVRQLSDLNSAAAKRSLSQYLKAREEYESNCRLLTELRRKYHSSSNKSSQSLTGQILDLEKKVDWQRDKLKKMRNSVISAELDADPKRRRL